MWQVWPPLTEHQRTFKLPFSGFSANVQECLLRKNFAFNFTRIIKTWVGYIQNLRILRNACEVVTFHCELICNVRRKKDCKIWSAWKVIKDRPKVYPVTTSKSIWSWNTNLTNACNTVSMFPTIIFHPTCQCLDV